VKKCSTWNERRIKAQYAISHPRWDTDRLDE
jgi:hypothetical protein